MEITGDANRAAAIWKPRTWRAVVREASPLLHAPLASSPLSQPSAAHTSLFSYAAGGGRGAGCAARCDALTLQLGVQLFDAAADAE